MLENYVKRCREHGSRSAARSIADLERGISERFDADKCDWDKLPEAIQAAAREGTALRVLHSIATEMHVKSKLNGEICAGVYMIADLYNELTAARKALAEANALLILNNLTPMEVSNDKHD